MPFFIKIEVVFCCCVFFYGKKELLKEFKNCYLKIKEEVKCLKEKKLEEKVLKC